MIPATVVVLGGKAVSGETDGFAGVPYCTTVGPCGPLDDAAAIG